MIEVTLPDRAHIIIIGRPHLDGSIRAGQLRPGVRAIHITDDARGINRMRGLGAGCPLVIIRDRRTVLPDAVAAELESRLAILRRYAAADGQPVIEWTC
jgi:hypothetical protein